MNQDPIPVILSCDDKFVRHAACTIASIVKNSDRRYQFYLLDCGISESNKQKLAAWDLGGNTLTVMPMGKVEAFERIATLSGFFPPANFYRLLIPELFPELTKAIYLDSDIVVVGDLGELWDIDLGDQLMGVVYMEPDFSACDEYNEFKRRYQIPFERRYFNNGVMLMNLEGLRSFGFTDKLSNLIVKVCSEASNQGVCVPCELLFNKAFDNAQLLALDPKFNFVINCTHSKQLARRIQPVCWHYICYKPWTLRERSFSGCTFFMFCTFRHYYRYAKCTPWKDEVYKDIKWPVVVKMLWKWCFQPVEIFVKQRLLKRGKA